MLWNRESMIKWNLFNKIGLVCLFLSQLRHGSITVKQKKTIRHNVIKIASLEPEIASLLIEISLL